LKAQQSKNRDNEGVTPQRPGEPAEIDEQTKAILTERLKTIDEDAKTARPWREVLAESRQKLKQLAPK
jgi:hypothetical protein